MTFWSPSGSYLAVVRSELPFTYSQMKEVALGRAPQLTPEQVKGQQELLIWNANSHKSKTLLSMPGGQGRVESIEWFNKSDVLLVALHKTETDKTTYSLVNPSTGTMRPLMDATGSPAASVMLSASGDFGFVISPSADSGTDRQVGLFGPKGFYGKTVPLPSKMIGPFVGERGGVLAVRTSGEGKNRKHDYFALNFNNGTLNPTTEKYTFKELDPKPGQPTTPTDRVKVERNNASAEASVIWFALDGAKPKDYAVVTTDGSNPILSPNGEAIAYESQGILMVRQAVPISLEQFTAMRNAAERAAILSKVKQVGLALLMYASDADDVMLGRNDNWQTTIMPYLKDASLMSGFVLTFQGGSMNSVESPASEMLGYIDGPGGRAVVYVDGHAKWLPNKP